MPRSAIRALFCLVLTVPLLKADRWYRFEMGPYEVFSDQGEKPGRDTLNYLEQLRYTLGKMLGKDNMTSLWPIRIAVLKGGKGVTLHPEIRLARDNYVASISGLDENFVSQVVRILIDSNAGPLPPDIDHGLIELFSTLQVDGTRVTLGAKPQQNDRDWSRAHLLSVDPSYSGRLGVLVRNLQLGVETEPAYRNAFGKSQAQIEQEVNKYIETGKYGTTMLNSEPIDPRRQLAARQVLPEKQAMLLADILAANQDAGAKDAYQEAHRQFAASPDPLEGLGDLEGAAKAGSKSAMVYFGLAKKATDPVQKKANLLKAAELNPRWAEPHIELAALETGPLHKIAQLKVAAQLSPRNMRLWEELAMQQEKAKLFVDAAKSWTGAEHAALNSAEREQIHQSRLALEQARLDQQQADRQAEMDRKQKEVEDLKQKALSDIRAFEARANAKAGEGLPPIDPNMKLEVYKEEEPVRISGALVQVDCIGQRARLHIKPETGKPMQILVPDPNKVVIHGGGVRSLSCGAQKDRNVTIQYTPRNDRKMSTSGDVIQIQFE